MTTIAIGNVIIFWPQYLLATVLALLLFIVLGWIGKSYSSLKFIVTGKLEVSPFSSPFYYMDWTDANITGMLWQGGGYLSTQLRKDYKPSKLPFSLLYALNCGMFRPDLYKMSTKIESDIRHSIPWSSPLFAAYRIFLAIMVWAGILLLTTPFKYLYVFLPHLTTAGNIAIAVVLSVSIFEAIISMIYFTAGISRHTVIVVESAILAVFTASLFAPSMSWINAFNLTGKIVVYVTLLALFLSIGAILPQLRSLRNIYRTSFYFTLLAYLFFIATVLSNVIRFL